MSEVKRVIDYMQGLPSAAEHAQTYATEFTERTLRSGVKTIDGAAEEKAAIPKGEKELVGRLNCNSKFTRARFVDDMKIGVGVSMGTNGRVRREQVKELDFKGTNDWFLDPAVSRALYSSKESTVHLLDEQQRRTIMAQCPTLSAGDANGISMVSVHERISIPHDLRHLMMKMYLILADYNLATVSKQTEMEMVEGMAFRTHPNIRPLDRLAAISSHDIVIDTDNFTPEEAGLLGLAALEYPSVWYCGDNIYTKCHMQQDDLLMISNGNVEVDMSLSWGSPDRLYHTMWSIAAKLDSVQALLSAIESMRGKCHMMANMLPHIEGNIISSMIPKSYSQTCALNSDASTHVVTNMPGYLSTSVSLVADVLYGETFEAVASCVAESLGAIGKLVSSSTPRTNRVINGLMRDYGLQHTSARENVLLRNWEIMAGRPISWEFGVYLKEYLLGLATNIINGADIRIPQILLTVPSLMAINTAYGMSRGWKGPKHLLESSKIEVAESSDMLCSIAWLVGERESRPAVFFNRSGKRPNHIGPREAHLSAEGEGNLIVGDVQFWLADSVGGRVDENEETASDYYRTEFAGTRCAIIYDYRREQWVEQKKEAGGRGRETLRGEVPPSERQVTTPPAAEVPANRSPDISGVNWGALKKKDNGAVLEGLRSLSRSNAIAPSRKPRYTRTGLDGTAEVGKYHVEGEPRVDLVINDKKLDLSRSSHFDVIKVDCDGGGNVVHPILDDLQIHGMLSSGDTARGHSLFSREELGGRLTSIDDAAALAERWGMGLEVYDTAAGNVARWPGPEDSHTIRLARNGDEFNAAMFTPGNGSPMNGVVPMSVDADSREKIGNYGNLFAVPR